MGRRLRWRVVVTAMVTMVMLVLLAYPSIADRIGWSRPKFLLEHRLALGLDLKGGVQFVLQVNADEALRDRPDVSRAEIVRQTRQTLERRIDELGVVERSIVVQGRNQDQLVLHLPGFTDVGRARAVLGTTARLEWKVVTAGPSASPEPLRELSSADTEILPELGDGTRVPKAFYLVERRASLAGQEVRTARVSVDENGLPAVGFRLTSQGAQEFAALTASHVGRQVAIVLDGQVRTAPVIEHAIPGGEGIIRGGFTPREAEDLVLVLRSGALPVSLTFLGGQYIGPTLGAESIAAGVTASVAGLVLVAIFMLLYYRRAGVNAVFTVLVNVVILGGALAWAGAALTLPGIAGVVLTIGMGVDANVLIFERIKEELGGAKSLRQAMTAGFDRVFLTILDTHVTALISAAVLFQFGTGPIRGFATTLAIGMLANVFTAVFVSRTLFEWTLSRPSAVAALPRFGRAFPLTSVDFLAARHYTIGASALLIAAALGIAVLRGGIPLGLDFTGGTSVVTRFEAAVSADAVRHVLPANATVQSYGAEPNHEWLIRVPEAAGVQGPDEADLQSVTRSVDAALRRGPLPAFEITGGQAIGPSAGADLRRKGTYATVASLLATTAYIALRFRSGFAIGALVATVHDMALTVAVLSVFRYEMTLDVVAAVLTVGGYSVNDTIVIFDRVREASRRAVRPGSIREIVNRSINQTLGRTVITAGVTLIAVLTLWLFGGDALRGFAFAMVIGVVTGTYSTVFVAAPVAAWLVQRSQGISGVSSEARARGERQGRDEAPAEP